VSWSRLAETVRAKPKLVLGLALLLLVPLAFASFGTRLSFNVLQELPSSADSVRGYGSLRGHFERGELSPVVVVLESDTGLWDDASFKAINDLTVALGKIPGVALVRSLTQPTGGVFSKEDLEQAGVADLLSFPQRLEEGATGVARIVDGLSRIRGGLVEMREKLPQLKEGLAEGAAGVSGMRDGIERIRDGIAQMRAGLALAADGLSKPGEDNDLGDLALTAQGRLRSALDRMHTVAQRPSFDPQYGPVYEDVATAYGALTGIDDTTGEPSERGSAEENRRARAYAARDGMGGTLREVAAGLRRAIDGLGKIEAGLGQIDEGLARLGPGLQDGSVGVAKTVEGVGAMIGGLDQILPGLRLLRAGLAEGAARVRSAGFGDASAAGNLGLTPGLVDAIPGLRDKLGFFISADQRITRLYVTLEREPYHRVSLAAISEIRRTGAQSLNHTPMEGTPVLVAGAASFFDDIRVLSAADFRKIIVAVIIGIFIVLALLLRSLVAPAYLVMTVLLSFLSTLGLTSLAFQRLLGHPGVPWWLPPFLFVMLVALGADYNIFLMSRIREESRRLTTADATARGLALTGHVITSAGLILAGTFAALMLAPLKSLQQFGFAVSAGILLDTFVVRSLLVPSIATILGRHNWWPSRRAFAP
jgi:RND superfamily putative drug exporter